MENLTVVHSNRLAEASYNLSLDEMRLVIFAATKIDSRKPNVGEIKIYPIELADSYDLDKSHIHIKLRDAVKSLAHKAVTMPYDEINNIVLPWLAKGIYARQPTDSSFVILKFSENIEPYLFELKEHFTSINFRYAAKLNSPFSFRLYQWLYKAKNLNNHKDNYSIKVELDIDWMKKQAGLMGLYKRWDVFRDKLIKPAINRINSVTDITVIWKPIKLVRKVTAVQFNYVVEEATQAKPLRPRLYRRPKVTSGSHAEGEWMRKNEALLVKYEKELKQYDPKLKLDIADLRRLIDIYKALGECSEIHEHYHARVKELNERTKKKVA